MAKDWAGWMGAIIGVIGLGFAAQQYFFGTFATTKIDDVKGCNGFLIKEKPVILSKKALPEAIDQKYLQDKILSCRDELQKNDKNAVAYTNIGEATRRLGDLPVALIAQQEAVKLDPNLQEAKIGLGLVQADMGKIAEANKTIQDTLAQKESAIAYFYQGVAFAQQKDWKSAEASYRRAINLNPNIAEAYYNLGVALGEQGNREGAIAAYQKAISINLNDDYAYNNLGVALGERGNREGAIAAYQKAVSINPNFSKAYYNLGAALGKQGKTTEAIAASQKAISLNPNYTEAYTNLGVALSQQGRTAEAIAAYQKAMSFNPNDTEIYYNLGVTLGKQGNREGAIAAYQKAISLNLNFAEAYNNLGANLYQQGNLEGALAALQKARDLYRSQGKTQKANEMTQVLKKLGSR